jgi:hypothetical protein
MSLRSASSVRYAGSVPLAPAMRRHHMPARGDRRRQAGYRSAITPLV